MIRITKKMVNDIMVFTSWDGNQWCNVAALKKENQTTAEIETLVSTMKLRAQRPGAPRNGKRTAVKC